MADPTEPIIHTCNACGTLIDVSEQEPLSLVHCPTCGAGQRVRTFFDHFQLQEILGAGGMGAVYRAFDSNLSRFVALKILRKEYSANPEFVAQFEREAATTASINHPHVVKVYSAGEDQGLVYIAMELVDKGSLDDLMGLQGRVAEAQVLEVGKQAAMGLNAALLRGLIHRDVKPGNILFADAHSAKIVDFGLATLQEQANKGTGEVWGTPYYVAPEKLERQPIEDFRSDMYSLGATLFHAVAGRPPFEAETASMVALKHLKSQVVSLQAFAPDVSSETAFVINKTLNKDPEKRYQTYDELIQHLDYARNEVLKKAGSANQKRARVAMEDEDEARTMSWVTFAIIAVVVLGGIGAWLMRDRLFHAGQPKVDPVAEHQRQLTAQLEPRYKAAREKLLAKQFPEAAELFYEISSEPDAPRPLLDWSDLHQGLALLFAGKEVESRRPIFAHGCSRYPREGGE
jgi:serine/threonine protein kinase